MCLKCKKQTELNNVEIKVAKNNRRYQIGTCSDCGGKVCKFIKKDDNNIDKKE